MTKSPPPHPTAKPDSLGTRPDLSVRNFLLHHQMETNLHSVHHAVCAAVVCVMRAAVGGAYQDFAPWILFEYKMFMSNKTPNNHVSGIECFPYRAVQIHLKTHVVL